jgi:all-trans-retinol 13,14-reductase
MHILGGFHEGGSLHKICSYLGILDKLDIRHTDDDCMDSVTYLSDGVTYRIPRGKEAFVQYFTEKFPEERENLRHYMDELYRLTEEVDLFYLRKGKNSIMAHSEPFLWSANQLIAHYVKNPKLRDVLAYMNPMYGGVKDHTPAYVHAIVNVLYIDGSSFFVDGSQQLADALAGVIRSHGGEVYAHTAVREVAVDQHRVEKVVTEEGKTFQGDWYISSIHPTALLSITTPGSFPASYRNRLQEIPNSYSAFCVYIKFKPDRFPFINHPCYGQEDYEMVWSLGENNDQDWPKGMMAITPPTRNQGKYAKRMVVNCIMNYEAVRAWEHTTVGHRGAGYQAWKQEHIERVLQKMERLYPGFKDTVEEVFAASPLTIRDYYNVKEGALYGYRKDCQNIIFSQVPIATKVRNLLLTGQNLNLHGICGVPLTAIETTEALVGSGKVVDAINSNYKLKR